MKPSLRVAGDKQHGRVVRLALCVVPVCVVVSLVACGGERGQLRQADEPVEAPVRSAPAPPEPAADCGTMTRGACLGSEDCTLVLLAADEEIAYACREATGPCEVGLAQQSLSSSPTPCTERPGCVLRPAQCYCPCRDNGRAAVPDGPEAEECDCECGGGPPTGCESEDSPSPEEAKGDERHSPPSVGRGSVGERATWVDPSNPHPARRADLPS